MQTPHRDLLAWLGYWRASLADGLMRGPDQRTLSRGRVLTWSEFTSGQLVGTNKDDAERRFGPKGERKAPQTGSAMLFFKFFRERHSHARTTENTVKSAPTVMAYVTVSHEGKLSPNNQVRPGLIRDHLSPSGSSLVISSVEAADRLYDANRGEAESYWATVKNIERLLENVEDQYGAFECSDSARVLLCYLDSFVPPAKLLANYDRLLEQLKTQAPSAALVRCIEHPALRALPSPASMAPRHLGQMGSRFPLAPSQRASLHAFLQDDPDPVFAINGPPGTGKTTLLQSVVSTLWVEAAVHQRECPLIVATSNSNQAVTNVVAGFGAAETDPDDSWGQALSGRWLPEVTSYGMYMPADSVASKYEKTMQLYRGKPQAKANKEQHFALHLQSRPGNESATRAFLERFEGVFGKPKGESPARQLAVAQATLHQKLKETVDSIGRAFALFESLATDGRVDTEALEAGQALRDDEMSALTAQADQLRMALEACGGWQMGWLRHRQAEPMLFSFLAAIGMKGRRRTRDRLYLAEEAVRLSIPALAEITAPDEAQVAACVRQEEERLTTALDGIETTNAQVRDEHARVRALMDEWERSGLSSCMDFDGLDRHLDVRNRHHAFLLATHYWEAGFLLASRKRLDENTSPKKLEKHYRRLAMLAPCFVSSLQMLPDWFQGYAPARERPEAMIDAIDLLIIDEAGQVTPQHVAGCLALAKRALAVGDVHQLTPIHALSQTLDLHNLRHYGLIEEDGQYESMEATGRTAGSGSFMKMAAHATPYAEGPAGERGLLLREHRRCLPQIIEFCNRLCYEDALEALTDTTGRPRLTDLPVMGYAHVDGHESQVQGSTSRFNEIEASTIARWIRANRERILAAYPEHETLGTLLAVVTPFRAQVNLIKNSLDKAGLKGDRITVGTVDALQGAEREIVLFSQTYSLHGSAMSAVNDSPNRINVAVSRAKNHFIVFGNTNVMRPGDNSPYGLLAEILLADPDNAVSDVPPPFDQKQAGVSLLTTLDDHRRALVAALTDACSSVIIVSPYITGGVLEQDGLLEHVRSACRGRGVRVAVITDRASNRARAEAFERACRALRNAGAAVRVVEPLMAGYARLHSKILIVDRATLYAGSFNWLSAPRYEAGDKLEHTARMGDVAVTEELVKQTIDSLKPLLPPPGQDKGRSVDGAQTAEMAEEA